MKILVTGGAGFIGSAVIRDIISNTADSVINLDKLTYAGNLDSLADVSASERYAFEQMDICYRAEVGRVFREYQPDTVVHLAAESHVDRSIDGPAAFIETNIVGTYSLLEAARQYWLGLDAERKLAFRFHHTSTDEVYGKGDQVRDWLYVEDHARALYKVVTEGELGETYNIGGHNEKQNIGVVHALCALLDELRPNSPYCPHASLITHMQDRPGHDLRYAIDASKIQRELNCTPVETFESGIRKTVEWYLNNLQWCRRVQDGSYQHERLGISG